MRTTPALACIAFLGTLLLVGPATATYVVVDTGQDQCFDATAAIACPGVGAPFYGQDPQHDGHQPSFTLNGDGLTVLDNNTGLTWQQAADTDGDGDVDSDDKLTWTEFQALAATLNAQVYGGYDDWRLPTIKELYSLIDFRGGDPSSYSGSSTSGLVPFIDTDYFAFAYGDESVGERIIDAQYWSSTEYVSTTMGGDATVFGVNFADGRIKGYPRDLGPTGPVTMFALCVRGNTVYGVNELLDNGDGTITDRATSLMWAQDDSGVGYNWEEALAWVQTMNSQNYLGHDDWRLPNAKELQSIVDYTRSPDTTGSPAIDALFTCTQSTNEGGEADFPFYWTGTTHMSWNGSGSSAAYVAFGRGMGYPTWIGEWLDVHGAGCQRSDPKEGDPTNWPYGRGPQGDAIRIYNFVRCVRDASMTSGVGIGPEEDATGQVEIPQAVALHPVYPNPFNPATTIRFELPEPGRVRLQVLDLRGRPVRTLVEGLRTAGTHELVWGGTDNAGRILPSGTYLLRLETDRLLVTQRVTLLK